MSSSDSPLSGVNVVLVMAYGSLVRIVYDSAKYEFSVLLYRHISIGKLHEMKVIVFYVSVLKCI